VQPVLNDVDTGTFLSLSIPDTCYLYLHTLIALVLLNYEYDAWRAYLSL